MTTTEETTAWRYDLAIWIAVAAAVTVGDKRTRGRLRTRPSVPTVVARRR
jgi:hypothetical protein